MTPRDSTFNVSQNKFAQSISKKISSYHWRHRPANTARAVLCSSPVIVSKQHYVSTKTLPFWVLFHFFVLITFLLPPIDA